MHNCTVCNGTEFYNEAGFYFCSECQTKNEEKREEVLELRFDEGTRLTKRKIPRIATEKIDQSVQWTTWEQYNFILIGLTDELIELGVTAELKLTVLQLWAFYLGKAEVAFTSKEHKNMPKLARSFHKKDSEIIYGKLKSRKRKRKKVTSNSSMVSSLLSETSSTRELNKRKKLMFEEEYDRLESSLTSASGSDVLSFASQSLHDVKSNGNQNFASAERLKYSKHAKEEIKRVKELSKKLPMRQRAKYQRKHVTTKYRTGPHVITPMKLWAIIYLALRIHNQDIHLADMLRYGREGHLSYYRLDHLLPAEMTLTDNDVKLLTQNNEITHKGMRRTCAEMAKFLFVHEIHCPDFAPLTDRYCKELSLPKPIATYAKRLVALSPPKMIFNKLEPLIPNYEGRAMAFVIVVLKLLLGLDGITEYETSRIVEKINSQGSAKDDLYSKLFSFREWQRYIECRRNVLTCKHFPTMFKNDSDGFGNTELYVKFIKAALSRRDEKPEVKNYKNAIPRELTNAMEQCVMMLGENSVNSNGVEIFLPSQTPQYSYLEQLLENPMYDFPDILRSDFSATKIYYLTKPKKLVKFAAELGIGLDIVRTRLHFLDKLVPQFEKLRIPSLSERNTFVTVTERSDEGNKNVSDYSENRNSQIFNLNKANQRYYDVIQEKLRIDREDVGSERETSSMQRSSHHRKSKEIDSDFGFYDITREGKLAICSHYDSDTDNESVAQFDGKNNAGNEKKSLNFYKKYNLQFPNSNAQNRNESPDEINSHAYKTLQISRKKKKKKFLRDVNGRFVGKNLSKARIEPTTYKSPRKIPSWLKKESGVSENSEERYFLSKNIVGSESVDESPCIGGSDDSEKLFAPSEDYWMYHCVFSRVKSKNFEYFESILPVSFQWLLNECADIVEMSTEDLYEQVCLVETYFAHVLRPDNLEHDSYDSKDNRSKIRLCKKKW